MLALGWEDTVSSLVNNRAAERECKYERLVHEIAELKAEQELHQLREKQEKALKSIAQLKTTHAWSASLEQLGNPPTPNQAAITDATPLYHPPQPISREGHG